MEKVEDILNQIDELFARAVSLQRRPYGYGPAELMILKNDVIEFAERNFPTHSSDYRRVHSAIYPNSWNRDSYEELIKNALLVVKHRVQQGQAQLLEGKAETEFFIEPGTPHTAFVLLRQLLEDANQKVMLVDPYVKSELLPLLHNVKSGILIRILTRQDKTPKDFAHELSLFNQQYSRLVEAKSGLNDFHDRFLVVDDRLFLSGATFSDLGKRGSTVTEMQDAHVKSSIMKELEKRWSNAQPIQ